MNFKVPLVLCWRNCSVLSASVVHLRAQLNKISHIAKCSPVPLQLRTQRWYSQPQFHRSLKLHQTFLASNYKTTSLQTRCVHTDSDGDEGRPDKLMRLPPLSQYPALMWPKFTNSLRNWFFTYFVIKPYFDNDFSMQDFMQGAHEAISLVSTKLSAGEFDDLEGLVDPGLLNELRQTLSSFSVSQQDLLRVTTEDIFFSFPHQIGIIIPDTPGDPGGHVEGQPRPPQVRHVEITVVLHVLRGMAEIQKKSENQSFSIVDFTKDESNKYRIMVCNYRFFKDFTEGCKDPSWIINMVNHFLPSEIQAHQSQTK